ncbi:helix-turn-helix domain-containing protein [Microbacterium sp. LWO14-1.2]|uniref:terminase gpP N-terminus-related DNA-binding protein n=1 Tax=Microbacterium sp. LWO14-1.2 TaxID=3135263 RepID=UPI0031389759
MNPETQERAKALFDQGMSRNAIARELDLDPATITRWAKRAGVEFDRSETEAATKAHTIDLAAGRIRLAEKMLAASEDMLDRIDDEYVVYNFGGKDNTFEQRTLDSAPVEVRRNVITTAGITFDKLTRIVERSDTGLEQAVGVLDTLAEGFRAAADIYRAETPDEA